MRVMNPGPGELWDRLSILGMKIENGKNLNLDVSEWEQEEYEILTRLAGSSCDTGKCEELKEELHTVNKNIWVGIDKLRAFAHPNVDLNAVSEPVLREMARLGIYIMEMNDIRAKLIGQINELFGIKRPEKIPSPSGNKAPVA